MSDKKRTSRSEKQANLDETVVEGVETKKRKPETKPSASRKTRTAATPEARTIQAKVDQLAETKAENADVKLVDPNTGEEVKVESKVEDAPVQPKASRGKGKKDSKVVDPNSGQELDAAALTVSKAPAKPAEKTPPNQSTVEAKAEPDQEKKEDFVKINRAPVLTLWVAVVAERQGFSREAGLSFGKAISGMLAQSKGRAIGKFSKDDNTVAAKEEKEEEEHAQGIAKHDVFGMSIKAKDVDDDGDVRAIDTNLQVIHHKAVEGYLSRAFKDQLQAAKGALAELASSYQPEEIGQHCYHLYEQFRPTVAGGQAGWGQRGHLDLNQLRDMAKNH